MKDSVAVGEPRFFGKIEVDLSAAEEELLEKVRERIGALGSIEEVVDFLYDLTADMCGGDRIGIAFVDESGERLVSRYTKAGYEPLLLKPGFSKELTGSSLEGVLREGRVRIIDDLSLYLEAHPDSDSTRLLVREGRAIVDDLPPHGGRPAGGGALPLIDQAQRVQRAAVWPCTRPSPGGWARRWRKRTASSSSTTPTGRTWSSWASWSTSSRARWPASSPRPI